MSRIFIPQVSEVEAAIRRFEASPAGRAKVRTEKILRLWQGGRSGRWGLEEFTWLSYVVPEMAGYMRWRVAARMLPVLLEVLYENEDFAGKPIRRERGWEKEFVLHA